MTCPMWQGERFGMKLISLNTCLWGQIEQMNPCQKYVTKPKPFQYSKKVFPLHPVKGLLRVQRDNSFCSQGGTGGVDHISILANIWKRVATAGGLFANESVRMNDSLTRTNLPDSPFQFSLIHLVRSPRLDSQTHPLVIESLTLTILTWGWLPSQ